MTPKTLNLGNIQVESGKIRITDPCYSRSTWCAGTTDVLPGIYTGYALQGAEEGTRIDHLMMIHEDVALCHVADPETGRVIWEEFKPLAIDVGVDSGQCGFFIDELYPNTCPEEDPEHWQKDEDHRAWFYNAACDCTHKTTPAKIPYDQDKLDELMDLWRKTAASDLSLRKALLCERSKLEHDMQSGEESSADKLTIKGIDYGFLSQTGYGDGSYVCGAHYNSEGKIVALMVTFTYGPNDGDNPLNIA